MSTSGSNLVRVAEGVSVIVVETPTLGDRSYVAHDGQVALVVDPQRDLDRVLEVAEAEGVRITHVLETHIHNDYVTGGLALAEATGAAYLVNAEDEVGFDRVPVRDGVLVEVSRRLAVRAMATPGHTYTHLSYALLADGKAVAVFTGGSLLFGTTGRPDLLGEEHTHTLVHHQYVSARRLAAELPDRAHVLPTHGFGSFCAAGSDSDATASTIGEEKDANPALTQEEERWVEETLAGLEEWPAYYVHMAPANAAGPHAVPLDRPAVATREAIAQSLRDGDWVVDLRHRSAFADGHVVGSLNIGVDGQFATYLGWLIPWGTPLTLLGESSEQVAQAQRELIRIGIDQLEGAATGPPEEWTDEALGSFPRATFAELAQVRHHRPVTVVDVRRASEHDDKHVEGAVNLPIHEVLRRGDELPEGELWVHCASGYRASVAASVLAAAGRRVVAVDDEFDNAGQAGLPLV